MNCNATSLSMFLCLAAFSSWKYWWNSVITSEIQLVCFPSFVLTVFRCTTSYTKIAVLCKILMEHVNALALWWPCACLKCVSGLRRLEKTLNFLRCIHVFDVVLKQALDINEGIWLQLFFHVIVLMGIVASVMGMSFIRLCFIIYIEVFSYCTLTETFAIGFQKWFDHEWIDFGVFCWKMAFSLTSYPYGLNSARVAQLLLFFDDINCCEADSRS